MKRLLSILLLAIIAGAGQAVAQAAIKTAPLNPAQNNNKTHNTLTVSMALAASGQPVIVINNPTNLEVTALHPASANAVAFVLFDNEGVLLSPLLQHKKAGAVSMITLKPQASETFTLPYLAYATQNSMANYTLRPNTEYRLLAIYRPLGLNANGISSAEISVNIKPATTQAAGDKNAAAELVLHSAINKDQQLALVYSKSIDDCLQLADKNLASLNSSAQPLCQSGKKINNSQPSAAYLQAEPGKQVQLCNENDITQCSNAVTVKGFADVEGCFDMNGAAVRNLPVTLRSLNDGQLETSTTDAQGCYSFADVNLAQVFRLTIDIPASAGSAKVASREATSVGGCIYVKDKEIKNTRVVIKQDDEANQKLWIEQGGCFDLPAAIAGKRTVIEVSASVQ